MGLSVKWFVSENNGWLNTQITPDNKNELLKDHPFIWIMDTFNSNLNDKNSFLVKFLHFFPKGWHPLSIFMGLADDIPNFNKHAAAAYRHEYEEGLFSGISMAIETSSNAAFTLFALGHELWHALCFRTYYSREVIAKTPDLVDFFGHNSQDAWENSAHKTAAFEEAFADLTGMYFATDPNNSDTIRYYSLGGQILSIEFYFGTKLTSINRIKASTEVKRALKCLIPLARYIPGGWETLVKPILQADTKLTLDDFLTKLSNKNPQSTELINELCPKN